MTSVEKIKNDISSYFFNHNMLSQRLPQVYILYKSLQYNGEQPEIVMGYLVNHKLSLYYIHYWVELDGNIHDIISESYNKIIYTLHPDAELIRRLSIEMLDTYLNMDSFHIEQKRTSSFSACMNGMFFEDLNKTTTSIIYNQIQLLYNNLIK
jgi:hypothetical protein